MAVTRILSLAAGAVMLAAANFAAPAARADEHERFTLLEENDSLYFNSDKHYTQGVRFSYLGPDVAPGSGWNGSFDAISIVPGVFAERPAGERSRRYAIALGQSVFTPKETALAPPDPKDRPYAGWLYLSASLLQETDRRELEQFEVELGVIGPAALGKPVQNNWHQLFFSFASTSMVAFSAGFSSSPLTPSLKPLTALPRSEPTLPNFLVPKINKYPIT